jgi:predicted transcriptional regulator
VQDAGEVGRTLTLRISVPGGSEGGLSLFGKDFGRYPLDPTFVIKMK